MTHAKGHENLTLTKSEEAYAERISKLYGVSKEEAAELVIKRTLEDRVRKNTGKAPARVYTIRK